MSSEDPLKEEEHILEGKELLSAIRKQIEYYFSRENLANDAYLVSQMNKDMFVPLTVISGFKQIRKLTTDADIILQALDGSTVIELDAAKEHIKPVATIKHTRNTLILRETHGDVVEGDIRALLETDKITDVRQEIGNNWFVVFESEEAARDALALVRGKQLHGEDIHARIKSEML